MAPSSTSSEPGCDAILPDGGLVRIRPIMPFDAPGLVAFHSRLSPESVYLRFFSVHPRLSDDEVHRFTVVDHGDREALVAIVDDQIVAVARYERDRSDSERAEVAFVVDDAHQGRGLATLLLQQLTWRARGRGIRVFWAETLAENHSMQHVFHRSGFPQTSRYRDGTVEICMQIAPTEPPSCIGRARKPRPQLL